MKLSLVVHAHQPPGNFDSVFHEGVDRCYGPFLDLLDEFDHVRASLHFSGSLLEWLERHAPERVEQLRRLVARGQVEPVAAGMYEPVLALLPAHDRAAQLRAHRSYLRRLFGVDTHTGWLTERVWEPSLAADLVDGGIDVVPLDERHFLSAGLRTEELTGAFVTEYQAKPLMIAPALEELRMSIPWRPVPEAVAMLRRHAANGVELAVFGDDMEKFGMWPGTFRSVIRGGWLRRFFTALGRIEDEIELVPLGEAVAAAPPTRRVYIPDGSYPEMLGWSMTPRAQRELAATRADLEQAGTWERTEPFVHAGVYLQFLAKYPEANHLHKRMLDVSHRVAARVERRAGGRARAGEDEAALPEMQRALWRAQANCAYWHGWFGGTYLPHLRHALWRSLLVSERALEADG
ncbi:MAG: alpha-amylase/4-alpha-glucanotransferase domain-containing protein, partial [Dehalococcoidia bacterium]